MSKQGVYQFGISIRLPGGREAIWDSDDTAWLEAQVMRDGMLVGYVPVSTGPRILRGAGDRRDRPHRLRPADRHGGATTAPAPAPALPRKVGVLRRFLDGFRYR